jgi:hypothetical protein
MKCFLDIATLVVLCIHKERRSCATLFGKDLFWEDLRLTTLASTPIGSHETLLSRTIKDLQTSLSVQYLVRSSRYCWLIWESITAQKDAGALGNGSTNGTAVGTHWIFRKRLYATNI